MFLCYKRRKNPNNNVMKECPDEAGNVTMVKHFFVAFLSWYCLFSLQVNEFYNSSLLHGTTDFVNM